MKLIDSIKTVIYEQLDDYEDVDRLFGSDIKSMFNYYRKNNRLDDLLELLNDKPLTLVPTLINTGDKQYEELAWGLVKYHLSYDIIKQGDRYILSLNDREDVVKLFGDWVGCNSKTAEMVFQEDLWENWEDYASNEMFEQLVEVLTEENYQELVTSVIENYGNKEVENARGEFDHWIEEDNLADNPKAFILTPDRILGASEDRYAFTALIDSPDLSDFTDITERTYDRAYNDVIINEYFNEYHKSLNGLLGEGKDVQRGSIMRLSKNGLTANVPVYKYEFDVTDKFWDVIKEYTKSTGAYEIDEYGWLDVLRYVMNNSDYKGGLLCPDVDEYPDEEKVNKVFNDIFIEELKWNL
tara:strand:- start:17 stop:1078 length:1062 start_codon:yes stop_codon:yes gene_type:complete